jgi:hypothetical protein
MNRFDRIPQIACLAAIVFLLPLAALAQTEVGQVPAVATAEEDPAAIGQDETAAAMVEAAVQTQLTFRSHTIAALSSSHFLEGTACPATFTMVSGACHPGFDDRVIITNQFPNTSANTWRCGFRNNNIVSRTIWVYTLCGK